jgi:hypothetical protein
MAEDGAPPALHPAELERLQLENERLRLELAERRHKPWYHLPTQIVPVVSALLAIAGFAFGIWQYAKEQAKNREEQQAVAQRELMKPWLESQREIYAQALSAAAGAANTSDAKARSLAADDFFRLYKGKMILVETKPVSDAMVSFGQCLDGTTECDRSEMNSRCNVLATAMADSMAATARMTFKEFEANKFKYTSNR